MAAKKIQKQLATVMTAAGMLLLIFYFSRIFTVLIGIFLIVYGSWSLPRNYGNKKERNVSIVFLVIAIIAVLAWVILRLLVG